MAAGFPLPFWFVFQVDAGGRLDLELIKEKLSQGFVNVVGCGESYLWMEKSFFHFLSEVREKQNVFYKECFSRILYKLYLKFYFKDSLLVTKKQIVINRYY